MKKLPVVYDAHYSINELIKDVGCLRTTDLRPRHTMLHDNDKLSLKIDQTRLEPTGTISLLIFDLFSICIRLFRSSTDDII